MPSGGSRSETAASSESDFNNNATNNEERSVASTDRRSPRYARDSYSDDDDFCSDDGRSGSSRSRSSSSSGGSRSECRQCARDKKRESAKSALEKVDALKGTEPTDLDSQETFYEDLMNEGLPVGLANGVASASQPPPQKRAKSSDSAAEDVSAIVRLALQQYQQQQQQQQQQLQLAPAPTPSAAAVEKKTKKASGTVVKPPAPIEHRASGQFALAPATFPPPAKTAREKKQQQRQLSRRLGNLGKQLQSALSEYQDLYKELNPPSQ